MSTSATFAISWRPEPPPYQLKTMCPYQSNEGYPDFDSGAGHYPTPPRRASTATASSAGYPGISTVTSANALGIAMPYGPPGLPASPAMSTATVEPPYSPTTTIQSPAVRWGPVQPHYGAPDPGYAPFNGQSPYIQAQGWPLQPSDVVRTFPPRRARLLSSNRRQNGVHGSSGRHLPPAGVGNSRFKCRWCTKDFKHESTKCRHEKEHWNDPYGCVESSCGQVFKRRDSMIRHLQLMHGRSPPSRGGNPAQSRS